MMMKMVSSFLFLLCLFIGTVHGFGSSCRGVKRRATATSTSTSTAKGYSDLNQHGRRQPLLVVTGTSSTQLKLASGDGDDNSPEKPKASKKRASKSKAKAKKMSAKKKGGPVTYYEEPPEAITVQQQLLQQKDLPERTQLLNPTFVSAAEGDENIRGARQKMINFDLSSGRPGAIIESEEDLVLKETMLQEIQDGLRPLPEWTLEYQEDSNYGIVYDNNDEDAIDATLLTDWTVRDLRSKFFSEMDPEKGDPDPNDLEPGVRFMPEAPKDEDGIEIGWTSEYGSSNPIDERTVVGTVDSYFVDEKTMNITLQTPTFHEGDLEQPINHDIRMFRKSLDIIETHHDPFLSNDIEVPSHVQLWHGYPERLGYPEKPYENNRFTDEEDMTPYDDYSPHKARTIAVQMARATNAEWLKEEVSMEFHRQERQPYEDIGTLVGTLRKGNVDPDLKEKIGPALKILGSSVDLLSIEGERQAIFRFEYHGLIKNKFGMSCWTQTLIRDCGVECDNVIFETGFRKRDPLYDGGFPWYGMCGGS